LGRPGSRSRGVDFAFGAIAEHMGGSNAGQQRLTTARPRQGSSRSIVALGCCRSSRRHARRFALTGRRLIKRFTARTQV
jgi:hypothetical protein